MPTASVARDERWSACSFYSVSLVQLSLSPPFAPAARISTSLRYRTLAQAFAAFLGAHWRAHERADTNLVSARCVPVPVLRTPCLAPCSCIQSDRSKTFRHHVHALRIPPPVSPALPYVPDQTTTLNPVLCPRLHTSPHFKLPKVAAKTAAKSQEASGVLVKDMPVQKTKQKRLSVQWEVRRRRGTGQRWTTIDASDRRE